MDIENVVLCADLLKKSSQVDFWINKSDNVQKTIEIIKKYGLIVKVLEYEDKFRVIVRVEE